MTAHLGYQIPSPAILEKLGTAFHWAVDRFRFAMFYTKVHDRLLRPLLAADQPPAPPPIRRGDNDPARSPRPAGQAASCPSRPLPSALAGGSALGDA